MPDDSQPNASGPMDIRRALQALPLESPPRSTLPLLQQHLSARRSARPRWPLAMAASLAVAALTFGLWQSLQPDAAQQELIGLQQQSQRLESLWRAARDDGGDATYLLLSLHMEDELQAIDTQLADTALSTEQRSALWQRRVATLRAATGVETTRDWLHAQGQSANAALVMAD